jgi:hypothetical protein
MTVAFGEKVEESMHWYFVYETYRTLPSIDRNDTVYSRKKQR